MLRFVIRKIRRKVRLLNWNLVLISCFILATNVLFILSISDSSKPRSSLRRKEKGLDWFLMVDQPFCKIESYQLIGGGLARPTPAILDTNRSLTRHFTQLLSVADGTYVIYKRTGKAEQSCVRCCVKYMKMDTLKTSPTPRLPNHQLQTISNSSCQSFVKVFPLNSRTYNFVQTICEVQCPNRAESQLNNTIFTRLHPLLTVKAKVRRKLEHWKHQNVSERPMKIILLNVDTLSRTELLRYLPITVRTMRKLGFVGMEGHALIGGAPISNYVGSLTGLAEDAWDEACGFSETAHFTFACPWVWKDFAKAHYVTAYFDLKGNDMFLSSPTDYYVGQDVLKLLNGTPSAEEPLDLLLQHTLQFNEKFASVPTFCITRLPSQRNLFPQLDHQLSKFLFRLKHLKNTFVALYSNNGPTETDVWAQGPNLERLQPVLLIRKFRSPLPHLVRLDSALVQNSRLLTTVWDLHETLRDLLRLSCFPNIPYSDRINITKECLKKFPARAEASSLLRPMSHYRSCWDGKVPAAVCPCNRILDSTPFLLPLLPLARLALQHLNSLVPHKGLCSTFHLRSLLYAYPLKQEGGFVVGISVKGSGGRAEMRLEQRLSKMEGNGSDRGRKALGYPLWTSHLRPNGYECLAFARNPQLFFIHKQFCLCK